MSAQSHLKVVPAEETDGWSREQDVALRGLATSLHRLNEAVRRAVDAGLTVELRRTARYHDAKGHWGDQTVPIIRNRG
jgi:hypothetical protein